jgi:hypothetical protein
MEDDEEVEKEGKMSIRELNDFCLHGHLILSMDTNKSGGTVAFTIMKCSKTKDYPDGNAVVAWQ